MPFDDTTRNQLQKFVGDARAALTVEFTRQLQNEYGLDPASGRVTPLESLAHQDDARRETARILRETLDHYRAAAPGSEVQDLLDRIVREQAFTVLNRLAALRMAEARGLLIESIGNGYTSKGFQLYARVAGTGLGEMGDAYRAYLFSIFDEFALDLSVLFDRYSPTGRLFPRETALLHLLALINAPQIAPLWAEDETIGWIYQYFNTKEERKQMRDESSAPRNSRELAVRNQFFTPRYVVEFLTDNTLGRTWYEMTQGNTVLKDQCRYLVRRPNEVFLDPWPTSKEMADLLQTGNETTFPIFESDVDGMQRLTQLAYTVNGYKRFLDHDSAVAWLMATEERINHGVSLDAYSIQNLLDLMFLIARRDYHTNMGSCTIDANVYARLGNEIRCRALASRAEGLPQEELLRQPVFIPHRPVKDPREIRMLDPACGSMHFGLYAFDLFYTIYEEAWDTPNLNFEPLDNSAMLPLHEAYADDRDAFIRDVPRLIIEHNIHGIDIDPRAVQIAGLSLWLRAQRKWHDQGIKPAERPVIRRANIVCAEPMPGEQDLLDSFIDKHLSDTPELRLLGQLVRRVFEAMKLAGEAGSLLKIEDEIAADITDAKKKWQEGAKQVQGRLFAVQAYEPDQLRLGLDVSGITDEAFWEQVEERIYTALRQYAEQAAAGSYQRRLFAEDAVRGFAFIDLCRKRYGVALMNPPFGWPPAKAKAYQDFAFPNSKNDLYCVFVERLLGLIDNGGMIGSITSRTAFFLSSMRLWREDILLRLSDVQCYADFGFGVLDGAFVETAAFVLVAGKPTDRLINFFRLNEAENKGQTLIDCITNHRGFFCFPHELRAIPGCPFSYWVSRQVRRLFFSNKALETVGVTVAVGLATSDNERFLRTRWEIPLSSDRWKPYPKGGDYAKFHQDIYLYVDWDKDGAAIKMQVANRYGSASRFVQNTALYFKAGLTYPRVSVKGFGVRIMPRGCIFSDVGQGIFSESIDNWLLLGLLNSDAAEFFMRTMTPSRKWEAGFLKRIPFPEITGEVAQDVSDAARLLYQERHDHDVWDEMTAAFVGFTFNSCVSIEALITKHRTLEQDSSNSRTENLSRLNYAVLSSYEINKDDITVSNQTALEDVAVDVENEPSEEFVGLPTTSVVLSYLVGSAFGRWDLRFATGETLAPVLSDPFAPLPICPPGMLQNTHGLPAEPADVPGDYPLRISWRGILVDDPGHPEDIEHRVQETLEIIWKDRADAIEQEACDILGVKTLRDYFRRPAAFFADHLQRYSKSRRQAPIYWPLSTSSGSYTLWLYYHRLTDQTLYTCVNDYVGPKLRDVSATANTLRAKAGSRTRAEEQDLENLVQFERELTAFRDELLRLAPHWKPDLNDGVQITAAPLWRLFRLPKWQKTLKETWDKLERGDYDWAHLAYSLWPDRVRQKCKTDKSLAIAHNQEELYIEPPASAKKKRGRNAVTAEMEMEEE